MTTLQSREPAAVRAEPVTRYRPWETGLNASYLIAELLQPSMLSTAWPSAREIFGVSIEASSSSAVGAGTG